MLDDIAPQPDPSQEVPTETPIEAPISAVPETALPPVPQSEPVPEAQPVPVVPTPVSIPSVPTNTFDLSQQRAKARARIQSRKQEKLEKILAEVQKKKKITNDQVQFLVRVSHATATRYLSELEKQGKVRQVGTKKGSFYQI